MAIFGDRIKVACSTTGSTATTLTLGSAVSGFQTLSEGGLSNGDSVRYVIEDGSNFEIGLATYATGSPDTLTGRSDANVSASSSSNNRINLSGSSTLFIAPTAADLQTVHVYSATSDLPSASDNHGMIAHVHGEGAMYFAHGGSWNKLANYSDITTYSNATTSAAGLMSAADKTKLDGIETSADVTDTTNVVAALTAGTNITIAADGTISSSASGGGGASYSDPIRQTEYTGTATTTFNASSSPALPAYTAGNIQVFLNGSKLAASDFTATNGTSVVLGSACAASDVVTIVEYGAPFASQYSSTIFTVGTSSEYNTSTKVLTTSYTANRVAVYLNGVKLLVGTDCTATNGTTIDLTNAAPVTGDKIEVVEHGTLADTVTTLTGLSDTPSSLGTAGQILQVNSGATALEFADASGGGVTVYDNTGDLPSSGNTDGDLAWVKDVTGSGALKAFYIWDGSAWKRVPTGTDQGPLITTEPPTSQLNLQVTSTVTMVASDPEGFPVTYSIDYNTTNNALPSQLSAATSINQSTGVFTFTPATSASNNGTFKARLNASDGARSTSRFVDFILDYKQSQKSVTTGWGWAPGQMWTDQTPTSNVVTKLFFTRIGTANIIYEWAVSNDDISNLTNVNTMSSTTYSNTYDFYDAGSVSVDGSKLLCSYNGYIYGYSFSTPFDRTSLSYDGRVSVGSTSHAVSALWYDNGSKIRYQNSDAVYTASASTAYDITTVGSFTSSSPNVSYRKTPNQQWAVPSTAEAGNDSDATIADLYYSSWSTGADYGSFLRYGTAANYSNSPYFYLTGTNALGGSSNPFTGSNNDRGKILFVSPDGSEIFVYADNSSGNNSTNTANNRCIARYKLNTAGTLAQLSDVASF
jgi:hypothetical protein